MTREEARAACEKVFPDWRGGWNNTWIDLFVALGMLKLDEPKELQPWEALAAALGQVLDSGGPLTASRVDGRLDLLGFKVVCK